MRAVADLDVSGQVVLLRADLNVPLELAASGTLITDDGRIRASLPTINELTDAAMRCGYAGPTCIG